jgi:ketosteroid isomerase-like protein
MKSIQIIMMLPILILSLSCTAQKFNSGQEEKKLMELSREWAKTAQSGNAEKILSYWSEDAVLMTPDQGKLVGHAQLSQMLENAGQIPGFEVNWEPQKAHVAKSGELGYVIAHKYFKIPDESGNLNTYYFIEVGIWEKQNDGTWKNTIDIYNPDPSIGSL